MSGRYCKNVQNLLDLPHWGMLVFLASVTSHAYRKRTPSRASGRDRKPLRGLCFVHPAHPTDTLTATLLSVSRAWWAALFTPRVARSTQRNGRYLEVFRDHP